MSIAVLVQVYDDVRRLAIAGGAVAGGDFRLKKLIAPLEQAGAKAPVFGRVAHAAQAVVESDEGSASAALLELASLVNAILYTQGETGITGELKPLETTDLGARETKASARVLKPLCDALSSTGSGRLELIRAAIERGTFMDLRLVRPSLNALDDPYPEIAELLTRKVLPMYGKAIVPELLAKLDIKGRGGHLHRLRLLHMLTPEESRSIILQALDEGSKEMRVVAIECLGTTGDDLGYLLDQTKAKAKDVRAAALRALVAAEAANADAITALKRAIDGADLELIIDELKRTKTPEVLKYVVAQAEWQLAQTLATTDSKQQGPAIARLQCLVRSMEGRTDPEGEAFLLKCFKSVPLLARIKSTPSGQDCNEVLAYVLARGTPKMRKRLASAYKTLTGGMLQPAFDAARETMTPKAFYEEFSPMLALLANKRGKRGTEHERATALANALTSRRDWRHSEPWGGHDGDDLGGAPTLRELDPRWLDAAINMDAVELVCDLARPDHAKSNKFLSERVKDMKPDEANSVLRTMVRVGHPGAVDAIIESLQKQRKGSHYGYYGYWYGELIAKLPRSAIPNIEAVLPTLPDKMVDQLMDSVLELKSKPE